MSDNYELFLKKKTCIRRLRKMKCPKALSIWRNYANMSKKYHKKSNKAVAILNLNLKRKTIEGLRVNKLERSDNRTLNKKAYLYH